jgi:hypothetical protein
MVKQHDVSVASFAPFSLTSHTAFYSPHSEKAVFPNDHLPYIEAFKLSY